MIGKVLKTTIGGVKKYATTIAKDAAAAGKYYKTNAEVGYYIGSSLRSDKFSRIAHGVAGAIQNTKVRQKDISPLLGGIGLVSPVPGGSIVGYSAGKGIEWVLSLAKKLVK